MRRRLIRRPEVRRISGVSDTTQDRLEHRGQFPQRVRIGPNSVGWFEDEVLAWLESRTRGGVERPEPAISERQRRRAERQAELSAGA
ncbi:MAG: helix-turn-helix transcriptional regulator [Thermodesulfobacteriota bacterium]